MKDFLKALGFLWCVVIIICLFEYTGLMSKSTVKDNFGKLSFVTFIGLRLLLELVKKLIAYLKMDREEIELLHTKKLGQKVDRYLKITVGIGFPLGREPINEVKYKKCCKLIDKLCKDRYVKIEDKKVFYNMLCELWTKYGMDKGIYTVPPEIQEKWKKAQADDKLRQLKKDF